MCYAIIHDFNYTASYYRSQDQDMKIRAKAVIENHDIMIRMMLSSKPYIHIILNRESYAQYDQNLGQNTTLLQ